MVIYLLVFLKPGVYSNQYAAFEPKEYLTHRFEFESDKSSQRTFLKIQNSRSSFLLPLCHCSESRSLRIESIAFGESTWIHGLDGNPELREVFVLPDMSSTCCIEQPYSVEQCTDPTRGRLDFVGSG
jgi:hypothetical protein